MKKLLVVSLALAFVLAMFIPQAMAGGVKVEICHIIAANDVIPFFAVNLSFGKVISVSENAVAAHLAHGDSERPFFENTVAIEAFIAAGAHLPAANCYIINP